MSRRRATVAPDAVAELIRRTRTDRGLPPTVTDPAVIDRVAAIVAAGGGGARDAA